MVAGKMPRLRSNRACLIDSIEVKWKVPAYAGILRKGDSKSGRAIEIKSFSLGIRSGDKMQTHRNAQASHDFLKMEIAIDGNELYTIDFCFSDARGVKI